MTTTRGVLLEHAKQAIEGDRNHSYGDPKDNFEMTAKLWQAYFENATPASEEAGWSAPDVAVAMILLKVARLATGYDQRDTWQDIAGYAACGWECSAPEYEERPEGPTITLPSCKNPFVTRVFTPDGPGTVTYNSAEVPLPSPLRTGDRYEDRDGDIWTVQEDGRIYCDVWKQARTYGLVSDPYGPLTKVES